MIELSELDLQKKQKDLEINRRRHQSIVKNIYEARDKLRRRENFKLMHIFRKKKSLSSIKKDLEGFNTNNLDLNAEMEKMKKQRIKAYNMIQ